MRLIAQTVAHYLCIALIVMIGEGSLVKRKVLLLYDGAEPSALLAHLQRAESEVSLVTSLSIKAFEKGKERLLEKYSNEPLYNSLLLLSARLPEGLEVSQVVDHAMRGGNILWALPSERKLVLDEKVRDLARQFGRVLDPEPATIMNYFGTDPQQVSLYSNISEGASETMARVSNVNPETELFSGHVHRVDPNNPLVFPLLTAPPRSVAVCEEGSAMSRCARNSFGTANILASALQARNNARIVFISGDSLFRPTFASLPDSASSANSNSPSIPVFTLSPLSRDLLSWTLQERGMLRLSTIEHGLVEERNDTRGYRIHDRIKIRLCLEQKNGPFAGWSAAQPKDMQVELVMMNTWIRVDLHPTSDGCLGNLTPLTLPNRYGVYTFSIRYQRHGWPHILHRETLVVRPFHYDEFPHFLAIATPYYMAWISMMFSSILLLFPLLLSHACASRNHSK